MDALSLPSGVRLELIPAGSGWQLELRSEDAADPNVDSRESEVLAARWLVTCLATTERLSDSRFRVRRLIRPPEAPAGERLITVDQTNRSVIVGEQAVVKWLRDVQDAEHPALAALAHLAEVGFAGVPSTFGALTWQAPSGVDVPLGIASAYLPGAVDGWQWCVEAVESGERPGFPAELGRLLAGLHVAFATPSSVVPEPFGLADGATIRGWHAAARSRLAEVVERIGEVDGAAAGTDGDLPQRTPSAAIADHREAMAAAIDRLLDVPGPTPIQRTHGDLHVGQVLSWDGGLAVIDFDGNPVLATEGGHEGRLLIQSPVRDLAQLLLSLDQVGRIADRRAGFTITAKINAWSRTARADLLAAYQAELADLGRPDVLDLRLLPTFLVEQACRDLMYAVRFLPRWAYATVDGLPTLLEP